MAVEKISVFETMKDLDYARMVDSVGEGTSLIASEIPTLACDINARPLSAGVAEHTAGYPDILNYSTVGLSIRGTIDFPGQKSGDPVTGESSGK
jgi:hypothetical protein